MVYLPRGLKTSLTIHLTADERQTLRSWQRATSIQAGHARRGRLLLLLADGVSLAQVAAKVGMSRPSVYKWARRGSGAP